MLLGRLTTEIAGKTPGVSRRRRSWLVVAKWAPATLVVLVTVLIGGVALTHLRRQPAGSASTPKHGSAAAPGEKGLLGILGVLRRPQTALDREVFAQAHLAQSGLAQSLGPVDAASARVATTTPWGARVLLALGKRGADGQAGLITSVDHGAGGDVPTSVIEDGADVTTDSWGAAYAGGATGVRAYVVVPDGVARVTFVLPQSVTGTSSGPDYRRPLKITVEVHGNVAAFEARRSCCEGSVPMIWYAPSGRVIKQIGCIEQTETPRPTQHVTATPATASSRAAQRDPATPNPVTVTPKSGGPTTTFRIRWRLLLTGATYEFDPLGPQGTGCAGANAIPGGLGGGTTDVRGQIYGEVLGPTDRQHWCPGIYRISVSVLSFGPGRPALHPTPSPFGSATFTVRR